MWPPHGAGGIWGLNLVEGVPEIEQHSIGFVNDYMKFTFLWDHLNFISLCQALRQAAVHEHGGR